MEINKIACNLCRKDSGKGKIPRGWKRVGESYYCPKCWRTLYFVQAVTVPVIGPVDGGDKWSELREDLKASWIETTRLSNWLLCEYFTRDIKRLPGDEKLKPMPKIYLYPEAAATFPEIPTSALCSIDNAIRAKYIALRYKLVWTNEISLPNYRYPAPAVIHNNSWKVFIQDEKPVLQCTIRRGGKRWQLRLGGGKEYYRQLTAIRELIAGDAVQCELALIRKKQGNGKNAHENGVADRDSGGNKSYSRVMAKLVMWRPKQPAKEFAGALFVKTDPDSLLVGLNLNEEKLWIYNADQLKRWTTEHTRRLNRLSEDQKFEQRPIATFQSRRENQSAKFRNRINTLISQSVAMAVKYALRRRLGTIQYDDSCHEYCDKFNWSGLRQALINKCEEHNIEFVLKQKAPVEPSNQKGE